MSARHEQDIIFLQQATLGHAEQVILEKINFSLAVSEFVYIVGKTGSGKSTLLKTLYGALPLQRGRAQVGDFDLGRLKQEQIPLLRREIGMIFQDFKLLEDWTVGENLAFVLAATDWKDKNAMEARIKEVLEMVQLSEKKDEKVNHLSGGQRQKVCIARAVLNKPKLIIADEPTGNLDPENSNQILYLLQDIAKETGSAVLFATHDMGIIKRYPARVFECKEATLLEI